MQTPNFVLSVTVDGKPLPLETLPLQRLVITASKYQYLPVGELIVTDPGNVAQEQLTLTDGLTVDITVGKTVSSQKTYHFRIFKVHHVQGATGNAYRIVLYHDAPLYWRGTATRPISATSSDAIQQIASLCSLTVHTDPTNDQMIWLPMKRTYSKWVQEIVGSAYYNDKSAFSVGVRLDGSLIMRNIADLQFSSGVPEFVGGFASGEESHGKIPLLSYKRTVLSGFNNLQGGYHGTMQRQTVTDSTLTTTFGEVSKVRATQYLHMASDVKSTLSDAQYMQQTMIDCGNVHNHYAQAQYQNLRVMQLFSSRLDVVTNVQTKYDLFDRAKVKIYNVAVDGSAPAVDKDLSGNYHIVGKVIYIDMTGVYAEKYTLLTDGHNTDPGKTGSDV